jgi:hypothetical protein
MGNIKTGTSLLGCLREQKWVSLDHIMVEKMLSEKGVSHRILFCLLFTVP